jgi:small-conductance mechanosensitive channel
MDVSVDTETAFAWFLRFQHFMNTAVFSPQNIAQTPAILITLLLGSIAARLIEPWLKTLARKLAVDQSQEEFYVANFLPLALPIAWLIGLWVSQSIGRAFGWPINVISMSMNLATAWLIIRFAAALIPHRFIARTVAVTAWTIAALNILGVLSPLIEGLQAISFGLGRERVTLLTILQALLTLGVLLWLSLAFSAFLARRLEGVADLSPTARVLFGKLTRIVLVSIAFVLSLGVVGIDLTALAVFTGAVGVGIGFGLQKSVSNLFAGIILLLDKSIKPGDIIEVGGTYGWVSSLSARYVEVETRDGTQFLIPNEDIISQRVFNWTHQNDIVRLKLPVRVAYDTDLRLALALMREAAGRPKRVLANPAPNPLVIGFGENGVDLELRFWIADVQNGVHNISSEVLLEIWDLFHAHGVRVPLPQRDVYVHTFPRSASGVPTTAVAAAQPATGRM